jgi:dihydrodipicolinate synthase/N-acetylneuraminate lyase
MTIEGKEIKTKIGELKLTRNLNILAASITPLTAGYAILGKTDTLLESISLMGISGIVLAGNTFSAMKTQKEIKQLTKSKKTI